MDIKDLCFQGPKEKLDDTQYAQPAIFVTSMALAKVLHEYGIQADVVAGLSLGEYAALCYAKAFSISDGAKIVRAWKNHGQCFTSRNQLYVCDFNVR